MIVVACLQGTRLLTRQLQVAPRPHNSGHLTIELVPQRSQFRAQLDAILDKVPSPEFSFVPQFPSAIMLNILGGAEPHSHDRLVGLTTSFYHPHANAALNLYGKESKPGRKIGHITAWGQSSVEQLSERISHLIQCMDEIRAERIGSKETTGEIVSQPGTVPLVAVTMGSDSGSYSSTFHPQPHNQNHICMVMKSTLLSGNGMLTFSPGRSGNPHRGAENLKRI